MEDAEAALFILGSSYDTARMAVDKLREEGKKVGVFTSSVLGLSLKENYMKYVKM